MWKSLKATKVFDIPSLYSLHLDEESESGDTAVDEEDVEIIESDEGL